MVQIAGHTFVVSGGASGLGEAVVKNLVSKGANVVVLDFNKTAGEALAATDPQHILYPGPVDVSDAGQVSAAMEKGIETFSSLHGAVACAGILTLGLTAGLPANLAPYGLADPLSMKRIFEVNVLGSFNVAQQVAQRIIKQGAPTDLSKGDQGVIVLTSSYTSTDGQSGSVAYSSTKGALSSMVLPMARDLASYGIRVNAVAPGVFLTPINSAFLNENSRCGEFPTRPGRPSEFASFVAHILENEMFNGAVLRQDAALRGAISVD
ncbi:putative short-chain dehydrogenase family protein [Pluteus cervinus]|uniref:Short-chain dehydrogenase family protein n=1 Tax=Pluteus cervinus TaxID=181527 RepID=A0ACD3AMX8_9AGAR|nr:putative short-chain dehydrogenase family protein [Pluteus cervinus]